VKHNPTDEELSAAARDLRREWESPELWPRIAAALAEESRRAERRRAFFAAPAWRGLLAAAAVLLLAVTASLTLWPRAGAPEAEAQRRLLTEKALHEVERAEGDYVQSIEDLSRLAEPRVQDAASPLMMSYREKLLILDGAIAECRARIDRNRFNARLRKELLSLYQEKQRTLQQLMNEDTDAL